MRVGAKAHVGEHPVTFGHHHAGKVFDVDLVHDPGAGRHDREVLQRLLAPPQEPISLAIARILQIDVARQGVGSAVNVGDDGVVDHQLRGDDGIDPSRIPAEGSHPVPECGEIH